MKRVWWKDVMIRDKVYDKIGIQIYQNIELFNLFAKRPI